MDRLIELLKEEYPHHKFFDCLGCSNSHSDENNMLHCMIHEKEVEEDELCKDFN
ncbi:hypothetical protein ACWA2B_10240 [Paenibacillus sp. CMM36]